MPDLGRIAEPIRKLVEFLVGARIDYHALYPCTVVAQSGNNLSLLPDDTRAKGFGLDSVPIKPGAPGYTYTVPQNARVLLGFEAGDPTRPYCSLWESGTDVTTITFDGGSEDIARTDDTVNAGYVVYSFDVAPPNYVRGPLTGYAGTAAGYALAVADALSRTNPGVTQGAAVFLNDGRITSGNSKLKA